MSFFEKLLSNDRAIMIFSLIMAVVCWFAVALTVDTEATVEVSEIPVDISAQTSVLNSLDLHAIDADDLTVSVLVTGERQVVGSVGKEDIRIVADLSKVTGSGTAEVPLKAVNNSSRTFDIESISPSSVTVKFDRLVSKNMPVSANITGLSVDEDFVVESETVSPSSVTVSGPENDVAKVERCVVNVDVDGKLEKPTAFQSEIILIDRDGNPVESKFITVDATEAEVVVPVKKIETLPLVVEFINVPIGFPMEELSYTMSNQFIKVAGIPDVLAKYSEINLGYIDMKTLDFSGNYIFDVELPGGFTNIDHIQSVEVSFDEANIGEALFTLKDFTVKNRPSHYDVEVTTTRLANVRVLGDKTILETLTADDIIAEIDLSDRNIQPGQFSVPLKIYMPTKGFVWAVGDYNAIIYVQES